MDCGRVVGIKNHHLHHKSRREVRPSFVASRAHVCAHSHGLLHSSRIQKTWDYISWNQSWYSLAPLIIWLGGLKLLQQKWHNNWWSKVMTLKLHSQGLIEFLNLKKDKVGEDVWFNEKKQRIKMKRMMKNKAENMMNLKQVPYILLRYIMYRPILFSHFDINQISFC